MGKVIIIGAGISGLTTAYFLKKPYDVLESKPYAGGLCVSFYENGFIFDCSGHFIHIKDEKIKNLVDKLTGGVNEVNRSASIYIKNKFVPYPFQANLSYLDEKAKKECVEGIIKRKNIEISTTMPFLEWSKAMFGDGITKYFMKPYNQKLWSYDLNKMTAEWSGPFIPKPDEGSIIKSAYSKDRKKYGYNSVFYYPKNKGCGALIDGFSKKIKINLNTKTEKIDIKSKTVYCRDGKAFKYNTIISTQPLPELINQIINAPINIKAVAKELLFNSVRCINIGIKANNGIPKLLSDRHWVYIPETKFSFYRIGIYSNVNKNSAPKNCFSFYVEYSSFDGKYKNTENVLNDLKKIGFIRTDDEIAALNVIDMPYAYVIFDKNRSKALETINSFLKKNEIFSIGRYGAWEYSFIEKNIRDAKAVAEHVNDIVN
jgi:protoporphyrinogen oxidase